MPTTRLPAQIAAELTTALQKQLGLDITVDYTEDRGDAGLKGFEFRDKKTGALIDKDLLIEKLNHAEDNLKKSSPGKAIWIEGLKGEIIENSSHSVKYAEISYATKHSVIGTATRDPFNQLLDNATQMDKLTPVKWDLHANDLPGLVKGLNNISRMQNAGVTFSIEPKTNKIIFDAGNIPAEEAKAKMLAIANQIVSFDTRLAGSDGKLTEAGGVVAATLFAFKAEPGKVVQRGYFATEKETGYSPEYIADLIENAQIGQAAQRYLNVRKLQVTNEDAFKKEGAASLTEDGRDQYTYLNGNLTSVDNWRYNQPHIGHQNNLAAIPNFTNQDNHLTNLKHNQTEVDITKDLDQYRAFMPVDMSESDPLPAPAPAPVKKKAHHVSGEGGHGQAAPVGKKGGTQHFI